MTKLVLATLLYLAAVGLVAMLFIPTTGGLTPLEKIVSFLIGALIGLYWFGRKR